MSIPTSDASKEEHLSILDLVRGGLAFWVLAGHSAIYAGTSIAPFPAAGIAVDLFMLLSGFLMAFIYWERRQKEPWELSSTWISFYIRRFFRIAPVYFLLLAVAFVTSAYFQHLDALNAVDHPRPWSHANNVDPARTTVDWINVLMHVTFLFGLFPPFASNNSLPDWSIGLEMQFYAVFPFLMLLFRKFGFVIPLALFTWIYMHSTAWFGHYLDPGSLLHFGQPAFLPLKINIFLIGILLGEARYLILRTGESLGYQQLLLALFLCFFNQNSAVLLTTIIFILWICTDSESGPLVFPRIFSVVRMVSKQPFFTFLADCSYTVYLVHLMVISALTGILAKWTFYKGGSSSLRFAILLGFTALVSYAIAVIMHRAVEVPGIELGKRLLSRIRERNQ